MTGRDEQHPKILLRTFSKSLKYTDTDQTRMSLLSEFLFVGNRKKNELY